MAEQFSLDAGQWVVLRPQKIRKKWRLRARHRTRTNDKSKPIFKWRTCSDSVNGIKSAKDMAVVWANELTEETEPTATPPDDQSLAAGLFRWLEEQSARIRHDRKGRGIVPNWHTDLTRMAERWKYHLGDHTRVDALDRKRIWRLFTRDLYLTRGDGKEGTRTNPKLDANAKVIMLSPSSRAKHLIHLKRFIAWSIKQGYRSAPNPAEEFAGSELAKDWAQEARDRVGADALALSDDEARALLVACRIPFKADTRRRDRRAGPALRLREYVPPAWLYTLVLFCLHTGHRIGVVIDSGLVPDDNGESKPKGLTWERVDLEAGTHKVPKHYMKNRHGKKDFEAPIHPEALEERRRWQRHQAEAGQRVTGDALVFPIKTVRNSIQRAARRAGIDHMRVHDFRHSLKTRLAFHVPEVISDFLTHHRKREAARNYEHLEKHPEKVAAELAKVPPFFPEGAPIAKVEERA